MFQPAAHQQSKYLHPNYSSSSSPNSKTKTHHVVVPNKQPKPKQNQNLPINFNKIKQMKFLQNIVNDFPEETPRPSTAPKFSETNQNVGIVFWYSPPPHLETNIEILAGVETCYLTDKLVPEIKSIIEKYQIYTYSPSNRDETPHEIFSKRAKLLSKELKMPIYFDKPSSLNNPSSPLHHQQWQVQYRVINETLKLGILKGSIEEAETKEEAIQREIQEELFPFNEFIPLNQNKIVEIPHTIHLNKDSLYTFHYQLNEKEKAAIEKNIEILQSQNYGELVDYQFRPLNEYFPITTNHHSTKQTSFNGKSRLYIKEFYNYLYNQKNV